MRQFCYVFLKNIKPREDFNSRRKSILKIKTDSKKCHRIPLLIWCREKGRGEEGRGQVDISVLVGSGEVDGVGWCGCV